MKYSTNNFLNPGANKFVPKSTINFILRKTLSKLKYEGSYASLIFFYFSIKNFLNENRKINQFYCNLCQKESPYFLHKINGLFVTLHSRCPNCDSRKRHRGLFQIYKSFLMNFESSNKILHFAPEEVFSDLFNNYNYKTSDLFMKNVDLKINLEKEINPKLLENFNLILCNHVLEHIQDDTNAIKQFHDLLKEKGVLILSVPGNWYENNTESYNKPDWNGHYRNYGLDIIDKLKSVFRKVQTIDIFKFNHDFNLSLGLTKNSDLIFLCEK